MDVLGWLWWLLASFVGLVWTVVWFLLGGWVSTLAQIGVIVLLVFGYKYGWRRAPSEVLSRAGGFGRFAWGWLRSREPGAPAAVPTPVQSPARGRRARQRLARRQPGDVRINVSTSLTLLMIAGLWLVAAAL